MNEQTLEQAMQLIFIAGNAKSKAMEAIGKAENGELEEAAADLKASRKELHQAHKIQTDMLTTEMNGEMLEKTILLIHAQDHFMAANTTIDLAEKFLHIYQKMEA
ncbi:PTS lactose/cellobiose transporter subunit IIA [Listeria costaricensis]|uniref:PTS lactose/cellobiose transporter subunit IIA n=1 Tax=Listeria costaricensis TaxID=2026604 RepID=UPI000C06EAF6|nr:PTS lactose/cellobiose transporter subunit IIA [Listeria costaricensis]